MSSLASWVPGITAVRTYKRSWLPRDVMTGLVLSALLVPQGMAYAELAGLPAVTGLYTSILCLIGYAIFGPSRVLVLGPDSSLGPMIAATILPLAGAGGDPAKAVALASMLAIFTGLIMVAAGVGKLGFVADLLSKPTILGYMNGLALTIVVGQLPKLLGFSVDADGFLGELVGFFAGIADGDVVPAAAAIGLASLAVIFVLGRWLPKIPAVLVAVIFAMVVSIAADLEARGVKLVGVLPQGLPQLTWPAVSFSDLLPLFGGALGIALVALTDTISTATSFAERRGELVDGDKEMIGIGASNVAAGLFQGFPVSTSGSRTAVADQAGGKSQLTGLVGAGVIAVMLLAVPGLFAALPQATLGAVVIMAAISLADIPATRRLWHQRKTDFVLSITAFLGVTLLGVLPGIAVAVMLSVANVFRRAWRPYQAELGKVPGMRGFHDTKRFDTYSLLPNAAILRFDAPLIFANSGTFRESVRAAAKRLPEGGWVIIAAEPITDVDTTACDMLDDLVADLDRTGKRLVLAELKDPVRTKLDAYGLEPDIPEDRFYPTLNEAVRACRDATGSQWQTQVREGTV
ncbi:MAG: sulfate permease [Candidatus Nanopelagicales bacterium]|nr:sulfate permease [Candidatus Nanopelagicales bacterium]